MLTLPAPEVVARTGNESCAATAILRNICVVKKWNMPPFNSGRMGALLTARKIAVQGGIVARRRGLTQAEVDKSCSNRLQGTPFVHLFAEKVILLCRSCHFRVSRTKWVDWSRGFCSCVTSGFHEHEGLSFQMSSPAVQSLCSCPYYGPIAATILCGWSNSEQFKFGMAPTDPIDSNRPYSLCQYTTAYHSHTHGNRFDVQAISA